MKKGFTLIELLAVIVILAVIALIATPIVLSIINDTKVSALLRSAEFYVSAVENSIMRENMNSGGNFNPKECVISVAGVVCDTTKTLEVEINGESPSSGNITFQDGKITGASLTFGDRTIVMNSEGKYEYQDSTGDGEEENSLITFTLDGDEYGAESGMTWEQWLGSDYDDFMENNDLSIFINEPINSIIQDTTALYLRLNGNIVYATDTIVDGASYVLG